MSPPFAFRMNQPAFGLNTVRGASFFLVTKESDKAEEIDPFNISGALLIAGLQKIGEGDLAIVPPAFHVTLM